MKRRLPMWASTSALTLSILLVSALRADTAVPQPAASQKASSDKLLEYARVDEKPLTLTLQLPPNTNNAPVLVHFTYRHDKENISDLAKKLLEKGYAVANVAWMPDTSDSLFGGFPRDFHACKAAIRFLRAESQKLNIDPNRIAVLGTANGATMAALVGVTGEALGTEGRLGDHLDTSSRVRAVCLVDGVTDWRNAELFGDEAVNDFRAAPYQLFSANIKEVPSLARTASAINFIRPRNPPVFMVDTNPLIHRAMYATWVESLKRAGVPVNFSEAALHEDFDIEQIADPLIAFLDTNVKPEKDSLPNMTPEQETDALIKAGLFKQARRIIEENLQLTGGAGVTGGGAKRETWRNLLLQVSDNQANAMADQLMEARKSKDYNQASRLMWTIREIVTDPTRLGQFQIKAEALSHDFDSRANTYRQIDNLNRHVLDNDWAGADRVLKSITEITAATGDKDDQALVKAFALRYKLVKADPKVWPPGVKPVAWASSFGQDLYGNWLELRVAGITQRFRYIAPGKFKAGSPRDEWGRQPDEAELKDVDINKGFWLAENETTQEFYEAVMGPAAEQSFFRDKNLPVENISFQHAIAFMSKLGVESRLPTQEEWEYACRAGQTGTAPGTGRLSDTAWFWDDAQDLGSRGEVPIIPQLAPLLGPKVRQSHPVKSKLPNNWGLYDMQGNVWEWCQGASSVHGQNWHVARGGGFNSLPESCRPARAAWFDTEHQSWNIGFRILVPAE